MLDKIKSLRGALYRKISKSEKPPVFNSRAAEMIYAIKARNKEGLKFGIIPVKTLKTLPSPEEVKRTGVIYPLIPPYSYANIKWDPLEHSLVYKITEPRLTSKEKNILEKLKEGLVQVIKVSLGDVKNEQKLLEFLEENIDMLVKQYDFKLSDIELIKIMYYIYRDFIGLNEIEPFLHDPYIEDIGCDGVSVNVYIVHQKYGSIKTSIVYSDVDKLRNFVTKLAERCDRYISYAEPLLDGSLPDGTRVQASIASDVTTRGPTFSIRKFRETPFNPVDMIKLGTASEEMLAYLWFVVENGANVLITGGVATGKTSILNTLSLFIKEEAKIVSIEDTRELSLPHENWIPGVARTSFGSSGVGEVSMFELLKESFRQNPDYLIVGEIRGKEAYVMFQAMASIPAEEKVLILNDNQLKRIPIGKLEPRTSFRVPALDTNKFKIELMPFQKRKHAPRRELYKITTRTGRSVITTPDHSLFSFENGKITVSRTEELKEGSVVLIPARLPAGLNDLEHLDITKLLIDCRVYAPKLVREAVRKLGYEAACRICPSVSSYYADFSGRKPSAMKLKIFQALMEAAGIKYTAEEIQVRYDRKSESFPAHLPITPELLRLVGYYISEGSLDMGRKSNRISLYAKQPEIIEDMKKCIKAVTGKEPKERETHGWGVSTELSFNHKVLFELLKQHAGHGKEKKIPDFIFGLSKEKIGKFLSGLYNGDGTFGKRFGYYTISKELASDLTQLLLVYGIVATIIERERKGRGTKDYEVLFGKVNDKREFLKYIRPLKKNSFKDTKSKGGGKIIGDIYFDRVRNIEKLSFENPVDVYDLVVTGKQNFVGGFGGVLLHNSGHPSMATMHAGSVDDVIKRLQTKPISLSPGLLDALDVVLVMVHAREKGKSARRIKEIAEIESIEPETGRARAAKVFIWLPAEDSFEYHGSSWVLSRLSTEKGIPMNTILKDISRRKKLLNWMLDNNITKLEDVIKYLRMYARDPEAADRIVSRQMSTEI